jgi:colanic acid/amylovoran biosynthesis glycosyltransferase
LTTSPEPKHTRALGVAYLINQYPAISHTFIKREIQALERRGVKVSRFALRGWEGELVDADDRRERERTRYVLHGGLAVLVLAVLKRVLLAPGQTLAAAALVLRVARGSDKGFAVHLAYLAEACVLRQWLADASLTHIHAHFATNPAEVAMLVRALGGPRYSFTAHGSDIMDRPAQMALEHTVGRASFVAAVCSFGRNQIWRWVPFAMWGKVAVVRCGLPVGYGSGSAALAARPHRLICVGRLSKEKGQMLLIEATAQLRDSGVPIELVLVGDGPMRAEIEQLVLRHRLGEQVRLTGWLDAQSIENELRQARALVVSSLSEGLPIVIMEAMANRRPVIAPFLSGIPELVVQGETGWLYPAGDVTALVQAMKACLAASHATWAALGDRAHQRVWSDHDADVQAEKLLALILRSASLPETC